MTTINISEYNLGEYSIPIDCQKDVCVDIGANVGSFTLEQAQSFKVVHFYEPFEPCFNIVKDKTKTLGNVTGWKEAVYLQDNASLLLMSHFNHDSGSIGLKTSCLNEHWVKEIGITTTVSLPTVLRRVGGRINYLKVDCETSEYYFLILQDLSNIDYIGIELHWQMGVKKYNNLIYHITKTHDIIGNFFWEQEANKEVLCRLKTL